MFTNQVEKTKTAKTKNKTIFNCVSYRVIRCQSSLPMPIVLLFIKMYIALFFIVIYSLFITKPRGVRNSSAIQSETVKVQL